MFDELKKIYLNRKTEEIVPFLKTLTPKDKKELQPRLEDLLGMSNFSYSKEPIFYAAALVCCNKTQYKDITRWSNYDGFEIYSEILDWYNPNWFSDFINEKYNGHPFIPYYLLAEWEQKGYITLNPETIADTLAHRLTDLDKYPVTLQKHIWHIFEYETTINWTDYHQKGNSSGILVSLMEEGKIDRIQILKECLLTANRNFNKNLTGWFVDLFNELKPTKEELLSLQPELLGTLHSAQSKSLNNSLNHIKTITDSDIFEVNEFITHIPVLITSTVKATVKGVIDIVEKILKNRKDLAPAICAVLCEGFINKDETIQKKLAKLLAQYGDKDLLNESLSVCTANILKSVVSLLSGFNDPAAINGHPTPSVEEALSPPLSLIRKDNEIKRISSFEDYIFFLNRAFENNQVYDILFIPVYIQQFHNQITPDNLYMLEPAVKKAMQTTAIWSHNIGLIVKFYASFFTHYIAYLAEIYPDASGYIMQLMDKQNDKFITWKSKYMFPETYPYYYMMLKVFDCIKKEEAFNLLSIPTHAPCRIDPVTLVQRLSEYQQQGKEPFSYDLQYALQQCALDNTDEALELAKKELNGELQDLMIFIFDKNTKAKKEVGHPAWWMTASITKYTHTVPDYTQEWGFAETPEEYLTGNFKWEITMDNYGDPALQIVLPPYHTKDSEKSTVTQFMYSRFRGRSIQSGDISLLMYTFPHSHDTVNGHVLLQTGTIKFITSDYIAMHHNALVALLNLHLPLSKMDSLLVAYNMLSADKTNRNLAAEIWIAAVQQKHVCNEQIGKYIGVLLNGKLFPAKRFTDLIENNLLISSLLINKNLELLIIGMFAEIKTPITNLRKLLEIYSELLVLNNSKADLQRIPQLNDWAEENSLKKIVKQIYR